MNKIVFEENKKEGKEKDPEIFIHPKPQVTGVVQEQKEVIISQATHTPWSDHLGPFISETC